MRVPVSWLKEFVTIDRSVSELANLLNMGGLGVEDIVGEGDDALLVLEVTANRGDCLSILGVAREVAALSGQPLNYPSFEVEETGADDIPSSTSMRILDFGNISSLTSVEIRDPDLCPRYAARLITGVRIGESPQWLKARLEAGGIRPINNVVDATNYVLLELGQPLHAFDFDKLLGGKIIVRRARSGETIISIDAIERELAEEMLVIADADRPVAIAGVMGGLETEVTSQTANVLLESAHFNPLSIRRTRNRLGMSTEASYRFERTVDPSGPVRAADRAAQLMMGIAGGSVVPGVIDVCPRKIDPVTLSVRPSFVNRRLGTRISTSKMRSLLQSLEFEVAGENPIECRIPTFRPDITREADLVEEVARLYGYDNIPTTLPSGVSPYAGDGPKRRQVRRVKEIMMRCGLQEVWTFSLTRPAAFQQARIGNDTDALQLRNPLTEDYTLLRTSMVPSLLEVLATDAKSGAADVHIFEIGKVYLPKQDQELPEERTTLAVAVMGNYWSGRWGINPDSIGTQADFFSLKGILQHLLGDLGIDGVKYQPIPNESDSAIREAFHPGRNAQVLIGDFVVGYLGEVHPDVAESFGLSRKAYVAELNLDQLNASSHLAHPDLHVVVEIGTQRYEPLPRYPAVDRDVAMILSEDVPADAVSGLIHATGGELLESVILFDVYAGKNIETGKRSLAFSLNFRAPDRTLTDEEVDHRLARIKDALRQKLGAVIREG